MDEQNALTPDTQAELVYLQEELEVRDQLVQQLSEELFRLIQTSSYFNPESEPAALPASPTTDAIAVIDHETGDGTDDRTDAERVSHYETVIAFKDEEIAQLRQIITDLQDRCQRLESIIQEFPQVYRRKFSERMESVRDKITRLQTENRSLRLELQIAKKRLASRQTPQ